MPAELLDRSPAAEARLAEILATSGAAAWDWQVGDGTVQGGWLQGDARFAALHGISAAEAAAGLPSGRFFRIIHPADRARIQLGVGAVLLGAEVFSKEFRILLPEGGLRWVHGRGRCHYDAAEQPLRFTGVLVDITEQKRVEEQLRIAQSAGGVGTFEHRQDFATASVSAQFCRLLGLHPARDLSVRGINALVLPGDPPIIDLEAVTGSAAAELRVARADDGAIRWLARRGEYLPDAETAGLRFSGVIYDITEAKRIEDELRRLNQALETRVDARTRERDRIWQQTPDFYLVFGADGLVQAGNPAWQAELGLEPVVLIGRPVASLFQAEDRPALAAALGRLVAGGRVAQLDAHLAIAPEGEPHRAPRLCSWTITADAGVFVASGRDITERARLEEQLRQSQKMEAVGQLTGGLAHDFNNLLTGVTGSLELLQIRVSQGRLGELDRFIGAAQGAANRAAALTHRLLAFSRRQTLDPKTVRPNRLIAGMEELVQRTVGPAIDLRAELAPDLWPILCDPNQLENALLNLCINARDAMPEGGRLTIRTANLELDERAGLGRDLAPGPYVSISVSDTGTGMTPEVMARAFDPFFTTKPLGQGTGLGLSMIYGFAKQSGGQVRIRSAPGQGTVLTIDLPRHWQEGEEEAGEGAVPPPRAEEGQAVLVVDDEPTVRMLVVEVLRELGYTAIEAADGAEGLAVLQSPRRIDLLISDVGLPGGMNGRQMADAMRPHRPKLPVLFITGYAESSLAGGAALEPGMQILTKPFAMEALATRIKAILDPAGSA
ncbi:PAS domain S-box protein [Teichococcus deserti]|nr:PAS domain S-box protein [Pseudoroseomonas deserti]